MREEDARNCSEKLVIQVVPLILAITVYEMTETIYMNHFYQLKGRIINNHKNRFDIKVYTVGEFYAHAEARKSPVLDGKVLRTESGKEVRYPVCLTPEEKLMSTKIVNVFG